MSTALSTSASKITPSNTTAIIYNFLIVAANTEYSITLPLNTKRFVLKGRTHFAIKLAYSSGDSGVLFFTIPPGTTYLDENYYANQTIYFQSANSGGIIELITFY
jgi:hypothetical protein